MGGRGGSPNATTQAPSRTPMEGELEFRQWLKRPRPAAANMVDDPDVANKVLLDLPDRGAYIDRKSYSAGPVVRDFSSDDVLFQGRSDPDLYRQISKFYGVEVHYTNERTFATKTYGSKGDIRTSPAARKYGVR